MPKSRDPDAAGERPAGEAVGHLDPEAVVAEEDVADAGDEHPGAHSCSTSTSSGWK